MLTVEGLRHYNTGFEIGDIFGRGRLKELIFDMKEQLAYDQGEIEKWREIAKAQAEVITKLYSKLENQSREKQLKEENDDLYAQLVHAQESIDAISAYAQDLEKKLDEMQFADREAYRILSAMKSKKNWRDEEVS